MSKFNKDSVGGTLTVVVLLSLVCSLIVAGAAVLLKPAQEIQKQLDKQKNILQAAGLLQKNTNVQETYAKFIEPKIVDLATGDYVDGMKNFDAKASAKNPATSVAIAAEDDKAGIKVRSKFAEVYLVRDEAGKVTQVVLPMYGNGLWSIMYGLVAVQTDANTINGITYYEQGETAGLGGEIANPNWQKYFVGKKLFNDTNEVALRVGKNASSDKEHGVDALSGATLTSNGVDGSFKYWFGPNGFGPYLAKFKAEGAN
ncbi:Na(+)-translocating NADH-quinone reductase subunit C [Exercitatus varius]|uniref:Na(+)-translocating NADH-quinone reductase subunit C n=1 Tax=Exercitatus varius TaxID=67857 RepID=A0ABT6ERQ5_9PAST|nr:Na(+)-translocating NADH-quinone reductase subunit C [Exercitatus varius]QOF67200.1 Na(+)-translocating NADH-quinone reductase subunit C [Actinobacillus sp. GY-402]MDG2940086.1 Na(+)-translocating NADH-quinone reductase subunit C [Exercitatus varius]MDG2943387.1 Na(+)-translocating NADH-quinone reductase subunit C [Exercitatus varius]MDG2945243.1 Na(+)-translocating NADH-quinone reductase subunit C [Exercitatus varius]MDG2947331.1 Na(+)-translocating NADH-quinone reductase subunit C [Exerci